MHDPLALLFSVDSSYFEFEPCFIGVETRGSFTRGRTVTDCYSDKKMNNKNGFLIKTVNREKFREHVFDLMSKY